MKVLGPIKDASSEEYRLFLEQEYHRLEQSGVKGGAVSGFEEVKLRLFLSLIENPNRGFNEVPKRAVND